MGKVRIVTDSNAYVTPELIAQHGVEVLPHRLRVGGAVFSEGNGFTVDDLFQKHLQLQTNDIGKLPKVLAADINTILDAYQQVGRESEQIVSIHMSSELSPMWTEARRAAEMLKGRHTIRVIDSLSTSFGLGLLVQMAVRAAEEGASLNEIARIVNGAVPHLYVSLFTESLNYLERSTQLGASQSLLGTMLGIKAMIMMEDGRLISQEKVQTREEVIEKLFEFVAEFANVESIGLMHHRYDQACVELARRLRESLPKTPVKTVSYPPSLAAYLGPNMLGVVVYEGTF